MAYDDLRSFIKVLEEAGELKRVSVEVDPVYEITEITDRISKEHGPAILFENTKGSDYSLVINMFGSEKRMCMALELDDLDELGRRMMSLFEKNVPKSMMDKVKSLSTITELTSIFPKYVKKGVCKEVILKGDDVDITKFPVLKCWPDDGGKFITLPCVFTKDPINGERNCGMYRMQVYDGKTTGMHWHKHHTGADHLRKAKELGLDRLEVAVVLGADPSITYSATAPMPEGIDEMLLAGYIRKKSVELIKCETVDLEVPANSEIVLEGYVLVDELRWEGPFGDHTGYYSLAGDYPVFHITCITHRKDPIYPATIVGKPPMEDCYLAKATERIFLPLLRKQNPEVVDMRLPFEGVFHNILFISIDKKYPMHAHKIMNYIWGTGQLMFTKMIVVLDKDIDIHNTSEVLFRLGNNVDWQRDVSIVQGPVDALDHSSPNAHWGHKIGIDATKKLPSEGHHREWPTDIEMSDNVKELVEKRWKEYGL